MCLVPLSLSLARVWCPLFPRTSHFMPARQCLNVLCAVRAGPQGEAGASTPAPRRKARLAKTVHPELVKFKLEKQARWGHSTGQCSTAQHGRWFESNGREGESRPGGGGGVRVPRGSVWFKLEKQARCDAAV